MVGLEELKKDDRFYIDDYNLKRIVKNRRILKYKIVDIAVGRILRQIDDGSNNIIPLSETIIYKYLDNPYTMQNEYLEYCNSHKTPYRSEEYFNNLVCSLRHNPYDIKKGAICINQYGIIAEGQHRCCIMLHSYGPEYKVKVLKLYYIEKISFMFLYRLVKAKIKLYLNK